jgi:hypothetical protein
MAKAQHKKPTAKSSKSGVVERVRNPYSAKSAAAARFLEKIEFKRGQAWGRRQIDRGIGLTDADKIQCLLKMVDVTQKMEPKTFAMLQRLGAAALAVTVAETLENTTTELQQQIDELRRRVRIVRLEEQVATETAPPAAATDNQTTGIGHAQLAAASDNQTTGVGQAPEASPGRKVQMDAEDDDDDGVSTGNYDPDLLLDP